MSSNNLQQFSNEPELSKIWKFSTGVAVFAAFVTIICLLYFGASLSVTAHKWIATGWFLGPPIWFAFENNYLLKKQDIERLSGRMARFRLEQDAAKMIWLGISALVVYLTKFQ